MNDHTVNDAGRGIVPHPVLESVLESWGISGKQTLFDVEGSSMWPCIIPGDKLLIVHGWDGVRPGALVAYRQNGKLIVHRLIHIFSNGSDKQLLLKGDNCPLPDPIVSANKLVGWVYAVQRGEKIYQLDTPVWQFVSSMIVLLARLSLGVEGRARNAKRKWFNDLSPGVFRGIYRIMLWILSLPGRYLTRLVWKLLR